jgi:hypothetical protein
MIQLLFRELVIAQTVWTNAVRSEEFTHALGDTVNLRVPARRSARTRVLRAGTPLEIDESLELSVPVTLTRDVYNGAPITDEELTLDITDFAMQVLIPQVRAVAEGIEDLIAAEMSGATYPSTIEFNNTDPYATAVAARRILNDNNVPKAGRTLLVGSGIEQAFLLSDRVAKYDNIGPAADSAIREATIGKVAGFDVVQSNAIDDDEAYAYHRTAFVLAGRTPKVPMGASFGEDVPLSRAEGAQVGASQGGISARWIMDYDSVNARDRSFTSTWVGTATVEDNLEPDESGSEQTLLRAVKIVDLES